MNQQSNILDAQVQQWLDEFTKLMNECAHIPVKDLQPKRAKTKQVRINFIEEQKFPRLDHLHD